MRNAILGLGLLIPVCTDANDTVGAEGAGGIEFKKTDEISMEKEVLTISPMRVRVEYEFINKTDHPITERIFFPMPYYSADNSRCNSGHGGGPLAGFQVWVNDKEIETSLRIRAILPSGEDVTDRLNKRGLSDQDIADYNGIDILCEDQNDDPDAVAQAEKKLADYGLKMPWNVSYVYYWDQTFPPGKRIKVAHDYTPRIGTDSGALSFDKKYGIKSAQELISRVQHGGVQTYCVDDGIFRAAQKGAEAQEDTVRYAVVEYVLTTGANWSGPIKDFTLNLEKGSPNDVVSLCFDGKFTKKDPLTLTSHIKNFVPKNDLQVLFIYHST
jgi:hypothetical protein